MAKKPDEAKISKAEAVRRALAEGLESLDEGISFIKTKFGIDMDKSMFSSYKSQEKARQQKKAGTETGPATMPSSGAKTKPSAGSVSDSIVAIKHLVDRLGADEVVKIAEIFRK